MLDLDSAPARGTGAPGSLARDVHPAITDPLSSVLLASFMSQRAPFLTGSTARGRPPSVVGTCQRVNLVSRDVTRCHRDVTRCHKNVTRVTCPTGGHFACKTPSLSSLDTREPTQTLRVYP